MIYFRVNIKQTLSRLGLGIASFVPETREKPGLDYRELEIALEFVMKLHCQVFHLLLTPKAGAFIVTCGQLVGAQLSFFVVVGSRL